MSSLSLRSSFASAFISACIHLVSMNANVDTMTNMAMAK